MANSSAFEAVNFANLTSLTLTDYLGGDTKGKTKKDKQDKQDKQDTTGPVPVLRKVILDHPNLLTLNIRRMSFVAAKIPNVFHKKRNYKIRHLELRAIGKITKPKYLKDFIKDLPDLRTLDLSHNRGLDELPSSTSGSTAARVQGNAVRKTFFKNLAGALEGKRLTELLLYGTDFDVQGDIFVRDILKDHPIQRLGVSRSEVKLREAYQKRGVMVDDTARPGKCDAVRYSFGPLR